MTIDEKIGQMTQIDRRFLNDKGYHKVWYWFYF